MTGGRKIVISEEQGKFIKDSVEKGIALKYIGKELSITACYISKYCKENNIIFELLRYTKDEDKILFDHPDMENKEIQRLYLPNRTLGSMGQRQDALGIKKIVGKQWKEEDLLILKNNFPNISLENLMILLPNYRKYEISYMAKKLGLKKSKKRIQERYMENGRLTPSYIANLKNQENILMLVDKYNGDVHTANQDFRDNYDFYNYNKLRMYKFLANQKKIDPTKWYLYFDIYKPMKLELTYEESLEVYKQILEQNNTFGVTFNKENTLKLFKYWAQKNNFDLTRNNLLKMNSFGNIFIESKLERSIRINYYYTYMFISALLDDKNLKPYHLSIQVPDKYWDDRDNFFYMVDEKISMLLEANIIDDPKQVIYLPKVIIEEYFPLLPFHKGMVKSFLEYFSYKNIDIDLKTLKYYDGYLFESKEELATYKIIKKNNYQIKKLSRKDRYYNPEFDEFYIPDFIVTINSKEYIVEYFGLYNKEINYKKYTDEYNKKAQRKIEYFSNKFDFIPLFPKDLKHSGNRIIQQLEERRNILT